MHNFKDHPNIDPPAKVIRELDDVLFRFATTNDEKFEDAVKVVPSSNSLYNSFLVTTDIAKHTRENVIRNINLTSVCYQECFGCFPEMKR